RTAPYGAPGGDRATSAANHRRPPSSPHAYRVGPTPTPSPVPAPTPAPATNVADAPYARIGRHLPAESPCGALDLGCGASLHGRPPRGCADHPLGHLPDASAQRVPPVDHLEFAARWNLRPRRSAPRTLGSHR